MPEESPHGYVIGFRELYDAITKLDQKVDDRFSDTAKTLANHAARLDVLEHSSTRRWQTFGVWATCAAALLAAIVGPLIAHIH